MQNVASSPVALAPVTGHGKAGHRPVWSAAKEGETAIFCNREINMKTIRAIGFDMDYTLAQYNEAFELLAYEGAKKKLVNMLGYPVS